MCLRASPTFTSIPPGPCSIPSCDFPRSSSRPGCFSRTATCGRPRLSSRAKSGNRHRVTTPKLSGIFLLHELIRINGSVGAEYAPFGGLAGWQQKRLNEYISAHLADEISLIDLANIAQLSPFHFARAFKRSFGDPPHRYLRNRRIEIAKTLLESPTASVAEIAQAVGFLDPASFTAAFRRSVGTTPTAYRRNLK